MKKGTAPGPDDIPADLFRAGNTALYSGLAKHFNHYLKNGMIPDQKVSGKTLPTTGLFTKILLNRMERILDDYQPVELIGFRKNFSCMDNIQATTQLIERSHEYDLPLVLVFVDYKKAFDSVETNAVLNALTHAGIPSVYIHLLEQCFSNTSTTIQLFDRKLEIPNNNII
ncbi:hypothetical protein ANCDUO_13262 [Ancylostoma duodenale]|uniref:Uncharacterized protein n=1 Tax=Ancylostoma duodenale TaxID=51022 RepID=A0A0C2D3B6_9BILA|nr:hypothetical protein ANCDUO_13262 [Ancylostoma duodenale]